MQQIRLEQVYLQEALDHHLLPTNFYKCETVFFREFFHVRSTSFWQILNRSGTNVSLCKTPATISKKSVNGLWSSCLCKVSFIMITVS